MALQLKSKPFRPGGSGSSNGFQSLGLSDPVYGGILRMGFRVPTPVQRKALPVILSGVDSVVMARTGSGKTVAFLVPLLEKLLATERGVHGNHVRGIILSPTRELSLQTLKVFNKLAADTDLRAIGIHGGEGMEKQFNLLASKPDVIIATPGRLAHHLAEIPDFQLTGCLLCILDEADRLIEMGFASQLREISKSMPESCQKALLSATMPKVLVEFTKSGFAVDPTVVRLDQEASVSAELRIAFVTCRSLDKDAALLHVLQHIRNDQKENEGTRTGLTLIFAATRHHVEFISALLDASGYGVTMIYGTLDQEARKSNLAAFRHGEKPILVVTDVAARGIDVPLIDHVIHYHFPPAPKLFVHRSGRAARAGRIGYCWGLCEPDELPYMIDLHLFLGRRPTTGEIGEEKGKATSELSYTLSEMTPEMVHYGSVPESVLTEEVENVERIRKAELTGSSQAETLRSLTKTCKNAMKQYRRTRTEASREAVRRAKAILEGDREKSGQRLGGGSIPPHPLLQGIERQRQSAGEAKLGEKLGIGGLDNIRKREDFLRALANFRPKESVFEAFATGKNKDVGVRSHIDNGRTTSKNKNDSSASLAAMKQMRRQMRMARDKGATLTVAGSASALDINGDVVEEAEESDGEEDDYLPTAKKIKTSAVVAAPVETKRRLSKAERRRLKNDPDTEVEVPAKSQDKPKKEMSGSDFRDPAFYMENNFTSNSEEAMRSRKIEASMQPSAAGAVRGPMGQALRIEEAMFDIVGDENDELVKKQRMMRWDKAKRKYVQTTVGSELSGDSKTKKTRLESGQLVISDKMKLGQLYVKWQKKTNRSVGRSGVFDDEDGGGGGAAPVKSGRNQLGTEKVRDDGEKPSESGRKRKGQKGRNDGDKKPSGGGGGADEVKTSTTIRKEREMKQNMNMKNMKKGDRRNIEKKQKEFNKPQGKPTPGGKGSGNKAYKKRK